MTEFSALGARVYGISVDSTWAHEAWREVLLLPEELVLLSDFNREFGERYDLLHTNRSGMRGVLRRCVLVIAPDGTIAHRWDNPDPPRTPHPDEILPAVRALANERRRDD